MGQCLLLGFASVRPSRLSFTALDSTQYYEPDTEFVYWYNTSDLLQRLHDVVKFPDRYEPIARKAYERTQRQYTVDQWIDLLVMPFVRASQRE